MRPEDVEIYVVGPALIEALREATRRQRMGRPEWCRCGHRRPMHNLGGNVDGLCGSCDCARYVDHGEAFAAGLPITAPREIAIDERTTLIMPGKGEIR